MYTITARENGAPIESVATLQEAELWIERNEAEDKVNGDYEPNFYLITQSLT